MAQLNASHKMQQKIDLNDGLWPRAIICMCFADGAMSKCVEGYTAQRSGE